MKRRGIMIGVWIVMGIVGVRGSGIEEPVAVVEGVRATAYSRGMKHNGRYEDRNAKGERLRMDGEVRSAAADWSRWPVGTLFRVRETGQVYVVDDYGRAMVGTSGLDLCKPTEVQVVRWG
ncbi:MAG: hypothetical protein N2035_09755, partial [Chthoniobacterales bacterium]|nr:hypothetical protein [Chthoniobacterales bacterium]